MGSLIAADSIVLPTLNGIPEASSQALLVPFSVTNVFGERCKKSRNAVVNFFEGRFRDGEKSTFEIREEYERNETLLVG